ncbi:MAG TPA: tetratricopeptide repeat protein [Planctomycetota bacterium]|nr:tetratricopeptide repeat protein [Planctomycetota bacterium]
MRLRRLMYIPIAAAPVVLLVAAAVRLSSPDRRHCRAGVSAEEQGLLQQAEDEYTLATRWQPAMGPAWLGLGRVQKAMGRFTAAEATYRRALEVLPENRAEAFDGLGWILLEQSRLDDVQKLAEQARQLGEPEAAHELAARRLAAMMHERLLAFMTGIRKDGPPANTVMSLPRLRGLIGSANVGDAARAESARLLDEAEALCDQALAEARQAGGRPSARLLLMDLKLTKGPIAEQQAAIDGLVMALDAIAARARDAKAPDKIVQALGFPPESSTRYSAAELAEAAELAPWTRDPDPRVAGAALLILARLASERGDRPAALNHASAALAIDPANVAARYELKRVQLEMGSFESAMLDIDPVADATAPKVIPSDYTEGIASLLQAIGRSSSGSEPGSFVLAISKLRDVVRRYPDWLQPRTALAIALYRSGKSDQALAEFNKLAEATPDLMPVQVIMAKIFLDSGNTSGVITHCQRVLAAEPGNPQALDILSEAYLRAVRLPEAMEVFRERIKQALTHDSRLTGIEAEFEQRAHSAVPVDRFINGSRLAMIYEAQGRFDDAEQLLNRMKLDRDGTPDLNSKPFAPLVEYQLGLLLAGRGDAAAAKQTLSEVASRLKKAAREDLKKLMSERPETVPDEAVSNKAIIDALSRNPPAADFEVALGKVCADADEFDEALEHTQNALKYQPDHLTATTQLSAIYQAKARASMSEAPAACDAAVKMLHAPTAADYEEFEKLGEYAQGDTLSRPAGIADNDLLRYLFKTLSGTSSAEAEYANALPNALQATALDSSNPARQQEVADIYAARKVVAELRAKCYRTLLERFTVLQQALRNKADEVKKQIQSEDIAHSDKIDRIEEELEPHKEKINAVSDTIVRLRQRLAEAQASADNFGRLAEQRRAGGSGAGR